MAYRSQLCQTCKHKGSRCYAAPNSCYTAYEKEEDKLKGDIMLIGKFMEYKGFVGSIEFDAINKIYHGKLLNIEDLVNYKADNIINLHEQYHLAIDDYIEMKSN